MEEITFISMQQAQKQAVQVMIQAIALFQQQFMRAIHIYALRSVQTIQKMVNSSKTVLWKMQKIFSAGRLQAYSLQL